MKTFASISFTILLSSTLFVFAADGEKNIPLKKESEVAFDDSRIKEQPLSNKNQIEISVVPFAHQTSLTPLVGLKKEGSSVLSLIPPTASYSASGLIQNIYTEGKWNFGILGAVSALLPSGSYAELSYTYYDINSSGEIPGTTIGEGGFDGKFPPANLKASKKISQNGAYQIAELFVRNDISFGQHVNQYWNNQIAFGLSFQAINVNAKRNAIGTSRAIDRVENWKAEINPNNNIVAWELKSIFNVDEQTKNLMAGIGPALKWISKLDILPQKLNPHCLAFFGELKLAPLFFHEGAKGTSRASAEVFEDYIVYDKNYNKIDEKDIESANFDFNIKGVDNTNYLFALNTAFKAGIEYTYKEMLTIGFGYRVANLGRKLSDNSGDLDFNVNTVGENKQFIDVLGDKGTFDNVQFDTEIPVIIGFQKNILFGSVEFEMKFSF